MDGEGLPVEIAASDEGGGRGVGDRIGCLVLAAGAGTRFEGAKQLAPLAGRPLLEHALRTAARAPVERVVVVLGSRAEEVLGKVELQGAEPVLCETWRAGMAESLKAGIAALSGLDAAVILLGDQPLITVAAVNRLIAERRPEWAAVRATYDGQPGHPVVLERRLFPLTAWLRGDAGARSLIVGSEVAAIPCEDIAEALDVDEPADLKLAEQALAN